MRTAQAPRVRTARDTRVVLEDLVLGPCQDTGLLMSPVSILNDVQCQHWRDVLMALIHRTFHAHAVRVTKVGPAANVLLDTM